MVILTTAGRCDTALLERTVGLEVRPDAVVVWLEYRLSGELVRRDMFPLPKDAETDVIPTPEGPVLRGTLTPSYNLVCEDEEIAVGVEWRQHGRREGPYVSRGAHVIKLTQPEELGAIAGAIA